ncbi:MAG TPA: PepSY domain-containing protein, partial [Candidatus Caccovicinus merdipullorum]|nr:PepSY domain-containing protein [Candidatus Caccovicinus merdipullorum]
DSTVVPPSESSSSGILDEAAALDIALAHAGITESDAKRVEIKRDYEDDIAVYEIQFRADGQQKYEFKIDAATGAVVSYDYERDSRDAQAASSGSAVLSEEEIRGIVQKRVPGAPAENIFLHLDEDDGRMEYEGTLFFDGMEYEFKIDAYSGSVTEWEAEQTHRKQP